MSLQTKRIHLKFASTEKAKSGNVEEAFLDLESNFCSLLTLGGLILIRGSSGDEHAVLVNPHVPVLRHGQHGEDAEEGDSRLEAVRRRPRLHCGGIFTLQKRNWKLRKKRGLSFPVRPPCHTSI